MPGQRPNEAVAGPSQPKGEADELGHLVNPEGSNECKPKRSRANFRRDDKRRLRRLDDAVSTPAVYGGARGTVSTSRTSKSTGSTASSRFRQKKTNRMTPLICVDRGRASAPSTVPEADLQITLGAHTFSAYQTAYHILTNTPTASEILDLSRFFGHGGLSSLKNASPPFTHIRFSLPANAMHPADPSDATEDGRKDLVRRVLKHRQAWALAQLRPLKLQLLDADQQPSSTPARTLSVYWHFASTCTVNSPTDCLHLDRLRDDIQLLGIAHNSDL